MSNEEYRQGYRDGFKDGYEQAKRDLTPPYKYDPHLRGFGDAYKCLVCGIGWDKVMGYVCPRTNCPSKAYCINEGVKIFDTGPDSGC